MESIRSDLIFLFRYLFLAERSLNPGLDAPVSALIKDKYAYFQIIKTVLWIGIGIFVTLLIAGLH